MAAALGRGETKNILIHVKFDRYNEINKDINQSTITCLAKLLKATNRGFSYVTVRNEEIHVLQPWIEGAYLRDTYITERGQKHLVMRDRKL